MNNWQKALQNSRIRLIHRWRALGPALLALRPRFTDEVPVAAVSKEWCLYISPRWLELPPWAQDFVILHELAHVLGEHFIRRKDRAPMKWNIATDLAINTQLAEDFRREFPNEVAEMLTCKGPLGGCIVPEMFPDIDPKQPAEVIYKKMPELQKGAADGGGQHQSGSASDGIAKPWETQEAPKPNEVIPTVEEVKDAIRREMSRQRGYATGLPQAIGDLIRRKPLAPWKAILRRWLKRKAGEGEKPDWARQHRRSHLFPKDVFVPANRLGHGGVVAIVVDTSGSIGEDELKAFLSDCVHIADKVCREVYVVPCDTEVAGVFKATSRSIPGIKVARGGTDLRPGIEKALSLKPDAVVVMTDGWTDWPDQPPRVPVFVLTVERDGPPWSRTVRVKSDG